MTYCNNFNCDIIDCMHNPKNIPDPNQTERVAHLEENPLYCKKGTFNRYQVEVDEDE